VVPIQSPILKMNAIKSAGTEFYFQDLIFHIAMMEIFQTLMVVLILAILSRVGNV